MHVHRMPVDLNISNLYAAEAAKKAAEAKQAAEVRRKLLRASAGVGGAAEDFDSLVVAERDGESSGQGDEGQGSGYPGAYSAKSEGAKRAASRQPERPLSIWA